MKLADSVGSHWRHVPIVLCPILAKYPTWRVFAPRLSVAFLTIIPGCLLSFPYIVHFLITVPDCAVGELFQAFTFPGHGFMVIGCRTEISYNHVSLTSQPGVCELEVQHVLIHYYRPSERMAVSWRASSNVEVYNPDMSRCEYLPPKPSNIFCISWLKINTFSY